MNIGVASENKIKINVVRNVFSYNSDNIVKGYYSESGINEQPINDETLTGAKNRINYLLKQIKQNDCKKDDKLDLIVAIENGVFTENNSYYDKAVIVIFDVKNNKEYSDKIEIPLKYYDIARSSGFDKTTIGKVMFDNGFVEDAKDPHKSITGIPRQKYIEDTLKKIVVVHNSLTIM
jgi:non-canonical (house-cleaning) NTP pyrophosphatase